MEKGKSEMSPAKYSVVTANNSYHGAIKVGITFTAAKVKKCAHDLCVRLIDHYSWDCEF
jgi:hypothetical protein